jgi:L-rhamnose-H+ transport protein
VTSPHLGSGLALAIASGVLSGACMFPLKFPRRWRWENTWLVFSIVSLLVVPGTLAFLVVPGLTSVYAGIPLAQWAATVLFGLGWGFAQPLFGLSIARLGLALTYAIVIGLVSVLGTLVPLITQARSETNALIVSGIVVMASGVTAMGWAGRSRERDSEAAGKAGSRKVAYRSALTMAIACGVLSPMLNYSFAFSEPIQSAAVASGTAPAFAGYAIWPVTLAAGFLPNVLYSLYLLRKNRSWNLFRFGVPDAALAVAMGSLWMGSLALYGMCAARLGALGTSMGWGIVQTLTLLTAAALGGFTHEWKGSSKSTCRIRFAGLALLIVATFLMAAGTVWRS